MFRPHLSYIDDSSYVAITSVSFLNERLCKSISSSLFPKFKMPTKSTPRTFNLRSRAHLIPPDACVLDVGAHLRTARELVYRLRLSCVS